MQTLPKPAEPGPPEESAPLQEAAPATPSVPQSYLRNGGLGFILALTVAAIGSKFIFNLMNRVTVEGEENIPEDHSNVLYCLNHNSIIDNFAFELTIYVPKMFFQPEYLPVQLADRKNFFGDPKSGKLRDRFMRLLGKYFFQNLKAFPVDRNRGDLAQVDAWIELLKHNIVVVFPEGTRSRTGEIGRGRAGVGKLIYQARPMIIPVHMSGTAKILGVGYRLPRAFQRVRIKIGKPLDLTEVLDRPLPAGEKAEHAAYRDISDRVLGTIRDLGAVTK